MAIFAVSPYDIGRGIYKLMRGWMSGTFCETFSFWSWCLLNGRRVGNLQLHFVSGQSKREPSSVSKTTFSISQSSKTFLRFDMEAQKAQVTRCSTLIWIIFPTLRCPGEFSVFLSPFTYMFSFPRRVTVCWAFFHVLGGGWKKVEHVLINLIRYR